MSDTSRTDALEDLLHEYSRAIRDSEREDGGITGLDPDKTRAKIVSFFSETTNERDMAKADAAAVRCLMNTYNLGGWTDALGPMERALVAEALADPYVCDFIRNESGELEDGWREIDIQPEGMEHELRYAAARHLIERHAEVLGRFRFTDAGKEHL